MYDDIEKQYLWVNNLVIFSLKSMFYNHNTGKKETEGDFKGWNNLTESKIKCFVF